jgi:hypothetical protein
VRFDDLVQDHRLFFISIGLPYSTRLILPGKLEPAKVLW